MFRFHCHECGQKGAVPVGEDARLHIQCVCGHREELETFDAVPVPIYKIRAWVRGKERGTGRNAYDWNEEQVVLGSMVEAELAYGQLRKRVEWEADYPDVGLGVVELFEPYIHKGNIQSFPDPEKKLKYIKREEFGVGLG